MNNNEELRHMIIKFLGENPNRYFSRKEIIEKITNEKYSIYKESYDDIS